MPVTEVRIAGFGGQGVMLAANVIGRAACIHSSGFATMTQNYGPEARGGASSAALVLSEAPILYPYTTRPDILAVLSQEAAARFVPAMNPHGLLLFESDLVQLASLPIPSNAYGIPATRLAEELGARIMMNIIVVGFFAARTQLLTKEAFRRAVLDSVPANHRERNLRAFETGFEYGLESPRYQPLDAAVAAE